MRIKLQWTERGKGPSIKRFITKSKGREMVNFPRRGEKKEHLPMKNIITCSGRRVGVCPRIEGTRRKDL